MTKISYAQNAWICVDLLAPIEVTRLAVKGGQEFQLNVDDRCGNVTEFVSTSCKEEPLKTISCRLSNNTFRVTVTGLKTDEDCVMIKAITDSGISSNNSILKIPYDGEHCDSVLCRPRQGAFFVGSGLSEDKGKRLPSLSRLYFFYSLLWWLSFIYAAGTGRGRQVKTVALH